MPARVWNVVVFQTCFVIATAGCGDRGGAKSNPGAAGSGGVAGAVSGGNGGSAGGGAGIGGAGVAGAAGAGVAGTGGIAGAAGAAGATGGGTPEVCSFAIQSALSTAIPTVGIVNWSTDLAGLSEARIEFTLNDPADDVINKSSGGKIDVAGTAHRALMLGLKAERTYTYRIVATGGGKLCTSADQTLTTGAATGAPTVTRTAHNPTGQARGFIVTCEYPDGLSSQARPKMAYIIDGDGDVVWWVASPSSCSRALIDWEGANMWMLQANTGPTSTGEVRRVGMDGTGALNNVDGLSRAHHDITVLPGGIVAALVWVDTLGASDLVERSPDGTLRTVVRLDNKVLKPMLNTQLHANSIMYHQADDTYTVGDVYASAYVKLTRQGKLLWQFGGDCVDVAAPKCATGPVAGNHGHHLLANGNIVFFNVRSSESSPDVYEYSLTETASALTATRVWSYQSALESRVLGDVQRLPNGNTLVTFSTKGQMHEVSPAGSLVQTISASADVPFFGYADFRDTLYGPPLR
jgi:hypothetical protein